MAAKDKVCGNNLVALKDLDLGAWIDRPAWINCNDQKWIGAPDPNDEHYVAHEFSISTQGHITPLSTLARIPPS